MGRPHRSRNALIRITYDDIGELAGVLGNTAQKYSQRGHFDPRDLDSVLSWVNSRRQRQGEPLIGMPTDDAPQADSDDYAATRVEALLRLDTHMADMSGGYDPLTGEYKGHYSFGRR